MRQLTLDISGEARREGGFAVFFAPSFPVRSAHPNSPLWTCDIDKPLHPFSRRQRSCSELSASYSHHTETDFSLIHQHVRHHSQSPRVSEPLPPRSSPPPPSCLLPLSSPLLPKSKHKKLTKTPKIPPLNPLPNLRLLQSPPHLRPRPPNPLAHVLGHLRPPHPLRILHLLPPLLAPLLRLHPPAPNLLPRAAPNPRRAPPLPIPRPSLPREIRA